MSLHPLGQLNWWFCERMWKCQRAFLQEQPVSLRHGSVFQHEHRHPFVLEGLDCACPSSTGLRIGCDHDGVIRKTIDQAVASHGGTNGEACIWTIWRDEA